MERKKAYIISLKYAPGSVKEFGLMGRKLLEHGWDVYYVVSEGYKWFFGDKAEGIYYISSSRSTSEMISDTIFHTEIVKKLGKLFTEKAPDFVCAYNPHPLNIKVLSMAKKANSESIRSVYLHEPYVIDKKHYGWAGGLYMMIVEFLQTIILSYANVVICPSNMQRKSTF
ncbi:MAG: hypothetical protein K0R31_397 [Clostridiales bacterium]|nr:hypothetical protein [Clostridiales bacterium]